MSDSQQIDEATNPERPLQAMFDHFYQTCFGKQEFIDPPQTADGKKHTILLGSGLKLTIDSSSNSARLR